RAEHRTEAVRLAEGRGGGFAIELAGLSEIDFLVLEVIDFEERCSSFAGSGRKDRRIDKNESVRIEKIANRLEYLVACPQRRVLAAAAEPQMAMVHQEIDTVLFRSDGIRIGLGHALDDFRAFDIHLIAAGSARLGANLAADDQGRFLRQMFERLKQ